MSIKFRQLDAGICNCPPCGPILCNVKIEGYFDGFFIGCPELPDFGGPPWHGTFNNQFNDDTCQLLAAFHPNFCSASAELSLSGKHLCNAFISGLLSGNFFVFIRGYGKTFWQGTKSGMPNNPTGVYIRTGGCDSSPSINIVPI